MISGKRSAVNGQPKESFPLAAYGSPLTGIA